jgi:phosphoribosylaminoimidazolecarboxamide formyltransferase/IMP cyclohydrolase
MPTALISVWDKTGVTELAARLQRAGFDILSTGGTAGALRDAGVPVRDVSDVTGFPEILDGRVKTLHPAIHAGILARRDRAAHLDTLQRHEIAPIDVLISNLYPFADVVAGNAVSDDVAIEHIDIGGPAMVRAAAKNHAGVIVFVDHADYADVLATIESGGIEAVSIETRRALAAKAFAHVAAYDSLVAAYLDTSEAFPRELPLGLKLLAQTRYGENPHQRAAVYALPRPGLPSGVAAWHIHADREMSYNNFLDASAAWGCVTDFERPSVVIVKHTLPCGIGTSEHLVEAYERALSGDPVSAFGGVVAANRVVTEDVVDAIGRQRFDIIIAPGYDGAALERLLRKPNLRVVSAGDPGPRTAREYRSIPGGMLVQEADQITVDTAEWTRVTHRPATPEQLATLAFAWRAVKWVKSNAIVLAQPDVIVGVGAGQPNRVESVRIAVRVAGQRANGSCLASDAFFPFPDGVEEAASAGVVAIAQPGGSVRDEETIAAADRHGIAMLFTGTRHFRH